MSRFISSFNFGKLEEEMLLAFARICHTELFDDFLIIGKPVKKNTGSFY